MGHDCSCKIHALLEEFVCFLECEVQKTGVCGLDTMEAGAVVDMVKDLAAAEKNCYEAEYYSTLNHTMHEASEAHADMTEHGKERAHINAWMKDPEKYEDDMHARMGYTDKHMMSPMHASHDRYGKAYADFVNSKHSYSDTHSSSDKDAMEMHANEYMTDMMTSVKDVYKSVDPDLRKKMKADFAKFASELPA